MLLEQFRKLTAHLSGDTPIVIPRGDHEFEYGAARVTKGVMVGNVGVVTPYVGEDPELYGLTNNVIVATRTLSVVEIT